VTEHLRRSMPFGALAILLLLAAQGCSSSVAPPDNSGAAPPADSVVLQPSQLRAIGIAPLAEHTFNYRTQAVGIIDFDQNRNVQVFTPYSGRIIEIFADLGDQVRKGQPLFSIESPDFIAAEANLISAAATFDQTSSALRRARQLYATHGIDQNDFETAVANQQSAEGELNAARRAVAIFGTTEQETNDIIARRHVKRDLIVRSPIAGEVASRSAAPGLLEQPGGVPAPFSVADLRTKWMVANVSENDSPQLRAGQPIIAQVTAYPGRTFTGAIERLGRSLDPNTHRLTVRCALADPHAELIPGMLASFAIGVRSPVTQLAIPVNGVVRNGDGTFAAWVTTDRHRFTQRLVKLGEPLDGQYPVLEGLKRDELVVIDGAVFVSNILFAPPSD
jgi:membrane fusion protein, heavy metal efflux system